MKTIYQVIAAVLFAGGFALIGARFENEGVPIGLIVLLLAGSVVCGWIARAEDRKLRQQEERWEFPRGAPQAEREFKMFDLREGAENDPQ